MISLGQKANTKCSTRKNFDDSRWRQWVVDYLGRIDREVYNQDSFLF